MSAQATMDPQRKIGKQIVPPLSNAIEISFRSIRIRFWRLPITMGGIILAIGFLTNAATTRAMAAAYPAYKPAKMKPVGAMRVDQ